MCTPIRFETAVVFSDAEEIYKDPDATLNNLVQAKGAAIFVNCHICQWTLNAMDEAGERKAGVYSYSNIEREGLPSSIARPLTGWLAPAPLT